jgi:hypothetical protein
MKQELETRGRKQKKYQEGFNYTKTYNKKVIGEILRIKNAYGLTAKNIVKNARNKNNPLHKFFIWDDKIAGERYRENQAMIILNEIRIVIQGKLYEGFEHVKVQTPSGDFKGEYATITEILSDEELKKQYLKTALTLLSKWK